MTPIRLSPLDLQRNFPSHYLARGRSYAEDGRVSALRHIPEQNRYTARVEGTSTRPYRVDVALHRGVRGTDVYGACSCPVGLNCKHVAAVLYCALDQDQTEDVAEPAIDSLTPQPVLPLELEGWVKSLERAGHPDAPRDTYPPNVTQRLLYVIGLPRYARPPKLHVHLVQARRLKAGGYSSPSAYHNIRQALTRPPAYILSTDQRILRRLLVEADAYAEADFVLEGEPGSQILAALLATGRCHYLELAGPVLQAATARPGHAAWTFMPNGEQQLRFLTEPPSTAALPLSPPWYVDISRSECGPIQSSLPPALSEALAAAPVVAPQHAAFIRAQLEQQLGHPDAPLPQVPEVVEVADPNPVACLRLLTMEAVSSSRYRQWQPHRLFDIAELTFDYAGIRVNRDSPPVVTAFQDGKLVRLSRNHPAERAARDTLIKLGFRAAQDSIGAGAHWLRHAYALADERAWFEFLGTGLARLREHGWRVEYDDSFRFVPVESGDWHAAIEEAGKDWFDLKLGIDIDGERMDLLPILVQVVRAHPALLARAAEQETPAAESVFVTLDNGKLLPIPLRRLIPLLSVLHELIDAPHDGGIRLPRIDAVRLADLEDAAGFAWSGGEALRQLGSRLADFSGLARVPAPPGFRAELRPYQEFGLAWLQFLREYAVGGILADDMGLGKTVQTLAHILIEKQAGRLDRPALVIAPTSVVPNWKAEAARFAPQLRVHVSHGLKRKAAFGRIAAHDLVLTTYPLLARDEEALLRHEFHLVILDEAQQIKNAQTQAARVVGRIKARHRLCLTGTPLENHLGELWSLFHFLLPGLLGDSAAFRRTYRTPIEKQGDEQRRRSLTRRIRPFLLRRTKDQVEADLPAKTDIVRPVELRGAQRDLYETVRTSMHERVRAEIEARGLARSRIIVLDALLKLRQVCCDPRLVKLDAAKRVKDSAKLELLMQMLEELLPEGRRILLFSQFTSMLELIESELSARAIKYLKLTGETRDRSTPVRRFQDGKVPLFLISLKAGGTGLNLTAADTVIHYDPWWNPAVENQATDRAHRIGQTKPVFVYKLIVSGSVEEKIAALQASKAALAAGILGEDTHADAPLTAEDVAALFEPLA